MPETIKLFEKLKKKLREIEYHRTFKYNSKLDWHSLLINRNDTIFYRNQSKIIC